MSHLDTLITDHLDLWSAAVRPKSSAGRGSNSKLELTGIKKLRELILELAVRGKLVPQDPRDEPASVLLERIAAEKARLVKEGKIKKPKALPQISEEEKPFALPEGWEWAKLGVCSADIHYGYTASANHDLSDYKLLRITDIQNNTVHWEKVPGCEISSEQAQGYRLSDGDILIARTGGTIGKSYLVENINVHSVFASYLIRVRRLDSIYAPYVKTFLGANIYWRQLEMVSMGTGQPNVNGNSLKNLNIPLPPLAEQHRIVAKVDELMALCDQLEQCSESQLAAHQTLVETLLGSLLQPAAAAEGSLTDSCDADELAQNWARLSTHFDTLFTTEASVEALKQTILQLAVMGKLVPQDPSDEPASTLLARIAAEKAQLVKEKKIKKEKPLPAISENETPFELPQRWEWVRLGSLYSFLNGFAFKSEWFQNDGVKLLRNINIAHGNTKWEERFCIPEHMATDYEKYNLTLGDIVISLDRPIINTGLKYAVIEQSDLPCLLLQRVAKFHHFLNVVEPMYLSLWLQSSLFISAVDPGRSNGVPHISTKQLEAMAFPLCSLYEQKQIIARVDELMVLCDQLKSRLQTSQQTQLALAESLVEGALS